MMETLRNKIKLDNNDNYILFEQGGIGKTSQMKAVFREFANAHEDGMVPIFVDCKSIDFNRKQPLLTHILLKFCGDDCPDNYDNSIVRLENMLTKANSKYKYVFFIDGINECENNKYLVVQDIAKLLKSPNNKIIVSSRINEEDIGLKDFKRLKVKEFADAQIVSFLNSKEFMDNGNDVELDRLNPSLLKILRIPMFLKLFAETYSADNIFPEMYTSNIVRKADLLQAFINKIFDDKNEQHSAENDPEYIKRKFALERYLPALAYEMMLMHKYSINSEALKNLRIQVFNSNYFERFENEDEVIFENISSIKEINNICIKEFSMLNKSNDNYTFSHQVWQDFFCGKFYELCIKYDVLEPFENAMSESVEQFIGEIIGECDFESKDNLDIEASPIEKFLQKHNLQQPENKQLSAIQTRNLVEIMKTSRNNNITADYSYLDLNKSCFIDCDLPNSIFGNSKISQFSFIPMGSQDNIIAAILSNNGKFALIVDVERNIIVWDICNNKTIHYKKNKIIKCVEPYLDNPIRRSGRIVDFYETLGEEYLCEFDIYSEDDSSFIVLIKDYNFYVANVKIVCDINKISLVPISSVLYNNHILCQNIQKFSQDDCTEISICQNKDYTIREYYDYKKGIEISFKSELLKFVSKDIFGRVADYNSNLKCLVTFTPEDIIIWDINTLTEINRLSGKCRATSNQTIVETEFVKVYSDLRIRFFDSLTGKVSKIINLNKFIDDRINSIEVYGTHHLFLGGDKKLYVFDAVKKKMEYIIDEYNDGIFDITVLRNGETVIVISGIDDELPVKIYNFFDLTHYEQIIPKDSLLCHTLFFGGGFRYESSIDKLSFKDHNSFYIIDYHKTVDYNENIEEYKYSSHLIDDSLNGFNYDDEIWARRTDIYSDRNYKEMYIGTYAPNNKAVCLIRMEKNIKMLLLLKTIEIEGKIVNLYFKNDLLYVICYFDCRIKVYIQSINIEKITRICVVNISNTEKEHIEKIINQELNDKVVYDEIKSVVRIIKDEKLTGYKYSKLTDKFILPLNIMNCNFENVKVIGEESERFYGIINENGGRVSKE